MSSVIAAEHGAEYAFPALIECDVLGHVAFGGADTEGSGKVSYRIDLREQGGVSGLEISHAPVTLVKSGSDGVDRLREAVRKEIVAQMPPLVEYDLRAIFYCMGRYCALAASGLFIPEAMAQINFVTNTVMTLTSRSLVVTLPGNGADQVLRIIATCARDCGVSNVAVVSDSITVAQPLQSRSTLRAALARTMSFLLADVNRAGCLGDHLVAMVRGISSVLVLNAHSDEGGWARRAMLVALYPVPRGILNSNPVENLSNRFCTQVMTQGDMFKEVVSLLIEGRCCFAECDPLIAAGRPTMVRPSGGDEHAGKPSSLPVLYDVLTNWETFACKRLCSNMGVAVPPTGTAPGLPRNSFERYFKDNANDNHLRHDELMPYLYVEPCGGTYLPGGCVTPGPGGPACPRMIDYFPVDAYRVAHGMKKFDARGRNIGGDIIVKVSSWMARTSGATYVAASAFSERNGYAKVGILGGVAGADEFLSNSRAPPSGDDTQWWSLADALWLRPDCDIPAYGECAASERGVFMVIKHTLGTNFHAREDLLASKVEVTVGPPTLKKWAERGGKADRCLRTTAFYANRIRMEYGDVDSWTENRMVAESMVGMATWAEGAAFAGPVYVNASAVVSSFAGQTAAGADIRDGLSPGDVEGGALAGVDGDSDPPAPISRIALSPDTGRARTAAMGAQGRDPRAQSTTPNVLVIDDPEGNFEGSPFEEGDGGARNQNVTSGGNALEIAPTFIQNISSATPDAPGEPECPPASEVIGTANT